MNATNELKFDSQICTSIEQSNRLLDMGLKPETADMELIYNIFSKTYEPLPKAFPAANKCEIPAWSLHRLIEILDSPLIEFNILSYNPYEEIIALISECIKLKFITNKYLKL